MHKKKKQQSTSQTVCKIPSHPEQPPLPCGTLPWGQSVQLSKKSWLPLTGENDLDDQPPSTGMNWRKCNQEEQCSRLLGWRCTLSIHKYVKSEVTQQVQLICSLLNNASPAEIKISGICQLHFKGQKLQLRATASNLATFMSLTTALCSLCHPSAPPAFTTHSLDQYSIHTAPK